ncbi:glycosyltransferase, partial [Salinisphaera sp.]|uniref:glycosyltransferase n=1 Tax=Salinisphaera sp. TaxID=1914330 RepID=UPI002D76E290
MTARTAGVPRPRVVHVIDRLSVGGMESVALAVIGATVDRYEHVIVGLRERGDLAARAEAMGVPVESIDKRPGKDPAAYVRLRRRLRALAPDIVHSYNIGAIDAAVPARLAGCRHVVHAEHGRDAADPNGSNTKYRWLRRLLAPTISRFVPVSADLARWLEQ